MLTLQYARTLPDVKVNVVDPGPTAIGLNGGHVEQSVEVGAESIVRMACIGPEDPTGTFSNRSGAMLW